MIQEKNILIYSTGQLTPLSVVNTLNISDIDLCEFVSSESKLLNCLQNREYEMIVVDSNDFASFSSTFTDNYELFNGAPLLVLDKSCLDENNNDTGSENTLPAKIILNGSGEPEKRRKMRDRKIINAAAATLGHEINNPLMTIYANAEMIIKENPNLPDGAMEKIKRIASEVSRIKKTTDRLINVERVTFKNTPAGEMIDIQ